MGGQKKQLRQEKQNFAHTHTHTVEDRITLSEFSKMSLSFLSLSINVT